MKRFVKISSNGEVLSHFPDTTGNYASLCGMDGDDNHVGVEQFIVGFSDKVNCPSCVAIFDVVRRYSEKDIQRK